jgi:type II secretory pathway predicted ATPase ExeA
MYEAFFGLSEKPFALTPNPRFVFQSEQYRTAEQSLLYGIAQKEGFMLVTGAPGTGKTTLCRDLLEKLDGEKHRVSLIFNPFFNGVEMLQALHSEFGLGDTGTTSRKDLLDRLNAFLLQQLANGRTCIAIFDEAQHLSTEFLEQIRVLSNLETNQEKLIQIILVGQPELLDLIRTPQMAQLDQRVSVRCTLTHLSLDETSRYIYHRLNVAGAKGSVRFEDPGIRLMHAATSGVPRLINLTCDRALLAGYSEQSKNITLPHVKQAVASLRGEEGIDSRASITPAKVLVNPPAFPRRRWIASAVGAAAIALFALVWWRFDAAAEFLSFKAALSSSPRVAEQAYLAIAEHHRASRQREVALLKLAQLHIAKGDARGAIGWLDVLFRDYPESARDAERQFWTARALLANGDTTRACMVSGQVSSSSAREFGVDFTTMISGCQAFTERQRLAAQSDSVGSTGSPDTGVVQPAGTAMPRRPESGIRREPTP